MQGWRTLRVTAEASLVLVLVALVAGQLMGQPVLLSYVTSGSMAPTLEEGDGFVAVPAQVAGPVEPGDVVVFRAEELHGGGLTTHRVVRETDRGFVTRGDANPFTDQDGGEPPVKRGQVVAVAWQPAGDVLVVPAVGTVVTGSQAAVAALQRQLAVLTGSRAFLGVQGLSYLLFAVAAVLYVADVRRSGGGRDRTRSRSREAGIDTRLLVGGMALLVVGSATAAMVAPAGTQKFGVVSAETDSPGPRVIEQGTSESLAYPVGNGGFVPVQVFVEPASDGVTVAPAELSVPARSVRNATVTLDAPDETGYYRRFVVQHRYLALLPADVTRGLHGVHPWLPVVVIDALLGGAFYALGMGLVGRGRVRRRPSRPTGGALGRLSRRFLS